jgi:hypothetical protein
MAKYGYTGKDYEEAAERLWQNYVVSKSKLSDIEAANTNRELRGALMRVIWRDRGFKISESNPILDFVEDIPHRTFKDGKPILKYVEPEFSTVTRYQHKQGTKEFAETRERVRKNFFRQNREYAERIRQSMRKQTLQESKAIRQRLVRSTAGRRAAIPIKTRQKGYAAQLNTMGKQQAIEKTRLTKEMRLSRKGVTTQGSKRVTVQQYSAHLKRSRPRVVSNANETAKLLNKLNTLEKKSRKKPLTVYK